MIHLPNGDIISDKPLPAVLQDKYELDPKEPNRYRLKWRDCIYHTEQEGKCRKSGRLTILPWCKLLDELISPAQCAGCPKAVGTSEQSLPLSTPESS